MELEKIKDNLFSFIHINTYLDLYNPGNASIPIKTINEWRKNVKALSDIATKQDKMIELMAEYIKDLDIDEDICTKNIINPQLCNEEYSNCKECVKQSFEKKADEAE